MHGAIAENRSVYDGIHEESWPRETLWVFEHGAYVQEVLYADFA